MQCNWLFKSVSVLFVIYFVFCPEEDCRYVTENLAFYIKKNTQLDSIFY